MIFNLNIFIITDFQIKLKWKPKEYNYAKFIFGALKIYYTYCLAAHFRTISIANITPGLRV